MQDLESGLSYMFNVEVGSKLIFHKVELTALQSFVAMLGKVIMTVVEMWYFT